MRFCDFIGCFEPYLKGEKSYINFLVYFTDLVIDKDKTEENPFDEIDNSFARKIIKGKEKFPVEKAKFLLTDKQFYKIQFEDEIYKIPKSEKSKIVENLNKFGTHITLGTFEQKASQLYYEIISDIASGKKETSTIDTNIGQKDLEQKYGLRLLQECKNICPCPNCVNPLYVKKGEESQPYFQIIQINPKKPDDRFVNLLAVCPNCAHKFEMEKTIDDISVLTEIKQKLQEHEGIQEIANSEKMDVELSTFSSYFTEGFLYVPEKGQKVKSNNHQIEITVFGDESKKCRIYAEEIVKKSSKNPFILQSVLNFKKAEQEIVLQPDVDFISKNGGTVEDIASQLRWTLFGPVIDKWIQNGKEMDIRIVGKNAETTNLSELENTYIILGQSSNRLSNIGSLKKESGLGKIFRNDNRRCAYCTLSVNARSSDEAIKLTRSIINNINFERGYGAKLSRDLEYMNRQYFVLFLVFIACVFFIVLFLTAITEDFKKTLFIISIIPASLFIPLIYKFLSKIPLELGDVVGMILVSGISVNNSIYIMESNKSKVIYKVRDKARSIIVTSLTSIIGAVPLIIMNSGTFASQLSVFMILGIVGSVIVSLFIFPGIISK